jgi:peptidoglycan-N-acetylglucosamine deacetylase
MQLYWHKNPALIRRLYPQFLWKIDTKAKVIYLTFDDGPIPEVTPWVLDQLSRFQAKATFFVIGDNVRKHPNVFQQVLEAGHRVGNHTFNHLNGWKTENPDYLKNVRLCHETMLSAGWQTKTTEPQLFRPPYVRIRKEQSLALRSDYQIVMWDVITGDFDPSLDPNACYLKTKSSITRGSIVIMHDSLKAAPRLKFVLPRLLEHFTEAGWQFLALPMH